MYMQIMKITGMFLKDGSGSGVAELTFPSGMSTAVCKAYVLSLAATHD